jgi:hypothetical protein
MNSEEQYGHRFPENQPRSFIYYEMMNAKVGDEILFMINNFQCDV